MLCFQFLSVSHTQSSYYLVSLKCWAFGGFSILVLELLFHHCVSARQNDIHHGTTLQVCVYCKPLCKQLGHKKTVKVCMHVVSSHPSSPHCRQLFKFSLVEGEEESRVKRVGIVKPPLLNLLGHISAWLLVFAFVFWAVFFNHPCLKPSFFLWSSSSPLDCFVLLTISSFNLPSLSFLHTTPTQRSVNWPWELLIIFCETIVNLVQEFGISLSLSQRLQQI